MAVTVKDLGAATAYAEAVAAGYTGTKADFEAALAAIASMSAQATTLEPDASATASYADGVLSLEIPKGEKGDTGATGQTGPQGPEGPTGPAGTGVPSGGTAGQVVMKTENGTEWSDDVSNLKSAIGSTVSVTGSTPEISAVENTRYICGEVSTLSFTPSQSGICDVLFVSGTTPTVLTVPNTVLWAGDFNPASLDASTTYELNILDGVYGVAAKWA